MKTNLGSKPALKSNQRHGRGSSLRCTWLLFLAAVIISAHPLFAQPPDVGGKKNFICYQGNAYIGALYEQVLSVDPSDITNLLLTVTQVYGDILASDPPQRMAALADEIIHARPDVLGVEELWTLEVGTISNDVGGPGDIDPIEGGGGPPAPHVMPADSAVQFTVVYDYLQLLTNALATRGAHYRVAVFTTEQDVAMPMLDMTSGTLVYGRIIDHEAILVRADLPPGQLTVTNPRWGQFANYLSLPSLGLDIRRGWCAVDVFTRGEKFTFICAHLEDEMAPSTQEAQGLELLSGPANVRTPVVIVGDFNADPLHRSGTTTYDEFIDAGFNDAWLTLNSSNPGGGLTWGHDSFLADPSTAFVWRIDYVLYRGALFTPTAVRIIDPRINSAALPLWPSDHAALAASFSLGNGSAARAVPRSAK